MGSLLRHRPFSRWGFGRGTPIDRYYIEGFLRQHARDVRGDVLEFGDAMYTCRYGGTRLERSDVLHVRPGNTAATIVGDVTRPGTLETARYDCIICTQTLQQLLSVDRAIEEMRRALKPGGVLLATVPGISQVDRSAMERWGDYWRFTSLSADVLIRQAFPDGGTSIVVYGNVLTASAFLYGLAAEELSAADLAYHDPDYQLVIAIRAVKPAA